MRLVIVESPYAGDVDANVHYARGAVCDCLRRGESPIAAHLLLTQYGILRDGVATERQLGIDAGHAWYRVPFVTGVFYMDRGMSPGMAEALSIAERGAVPVEFRFFDPLARVTGQLPVYGDPPRRPVWQSAPFMAPSQGMVTEGRTGRLEAGFTRRPRTPVAPYSASVRGRVAAFYPTMDDARAGAELWDAFLAGNRDLWPQIARLSTP